MQFMNKTIVLLSIVSLGVVSCSKEVKAPEATSEVSQEAKDKIFALGYTSTGAQKIEEGYLVEGDIVLTENDLNSTSVNHFLRIGGEEQYRTNNLVTGLPRVITVSISDQLPASYVAALDEALGRYNAQNLLITFQRVSSGADISMVKAGGNYLASAGFPSGGEPYGQVKVNNRAIGNQPQSTVATIMAHELGHCIGFRHTDYMNRAYSCGGAASNEGASSVGAVLIPGTPSGPDPNSWMLACIGSGQNRPFNNNDRTALNYLY